MLGVGLTALMASFMSGMAGNVTAFNTVFTYDLYQSYIRKGAPDSHYLRVARLATIGGVALSIATAYLAALFNNIMDLLQLVFSFVNAPLVRDVPAGDVLEADHRAWSVRGSAGRNRRGGGDARIDHRRRQGRLDFRRSHVSFDHGAEFLDGDFRVVDLLCRDDRGEPDNGRETGSRSCEGWFMD